MSGILVVLLGARILFAQPLPKPDWPDLAKANNPIRISLMVHVEEGKAVRPERYRQIAGGLRALARTFEKHAARINLDVEPGFVRASLESGDGLLAELEQKYRVAIGAFPHGAPARETLELIRQTKATPVYLFGNWGKTNTDWVGDAVANHIDVMLGFFSVLSPDVTPGSPFDHETLPFNRAERVHPWRLGSTSTFLHHDPAGKVIYIPGDSIDELEKLYERYLTGLWNRPLDRIAPPPSLDDRDFAIASDYLRRHLAFADPAKLNTWYIAVNSKKVRDLAAPAPLFDRWLDDVDREFVKPGIARWANAAEVRQAYLAWEKRPQSPPLYLTIVMHNEENQPWSQNRDYYLRNRELVRKLALLVKAKSAVMNFQPDWNYLVAVSKYETDELKAGTGGKNIVRWMVEDLGFEADPHAHETRYNYADVAYLLEQLGVKPSRNAGGFLYDPPDNPQGWEQHEKGVNGRVYPSYFWRADQIWGAGTAMHRGNDERRHGIWKPKDRYHFYEHDASKRLAYIGGNCYAWSGISMGDVAALQHAVNALSSGEAPREGFYTADIFIAQGQLSEDLLRKIEADLDALRPLAGQGRLVWSTLTRTAERWRKDYQSKPFQYPCIGLSK